MLTFFLPELNFELSDDVSAEKMAAAGMKMPASGELYAQKNINM